MILACITKTMRLSTVTVLSVRLNAFVCAVSNIAAAICVYVVLRLAVIVMGEAQ